MKSFKIFLAIVAIAVIGATCYSFNAYSQSYFWYVNYIPLPKGADNINQIRRHQLTDSFFYENYYSKLPPLDSIFNENNKWVKSDYESNKSKYYKTFNNTISADYNPYPKDGTIEGKFSYGKDYGAIVKFSITNYSDRIRVEYRMDWDDGTTILQTRSFQFSDGNFCCIKKDSTYRYKSECTKISGIIPKKTEKIDVACVNSFVNSVNKATKLGIRLGYNTANMRFTSDKWKQGISNKLSADETDFFTGGIFLEANLFNNLFIRPEIDYVGRGYTNPSFYEGRNFPSEECKINSLDFRLPFIYYVDIPLFPLYEGTEAYPLRVYPMVQAMASYSKLSSAAYPSDFEPTSLNYSWGFGFGLKYTNYGNGLGEFFQGTSIGLEFQWNRGIKPINKGYDAFYKGSEVALNFSKSLPFSKFSRSGRKIDECVTVKLDTIPPDKRRHPEAPCDTCKEVENVKIKNCEIPISICNALDGVKFESSKSDLTDISKGILDNVSMLLKYMNATEYQIKIVGHTDSTGSDNYALSFARVLSVYNYLVNEKGVSKELFTTPDPKDGKGMDYPIEKKRVSEKNRRIEFIPQKK
ncbi:MAG: OmpA family protein [Ignavibacteria bacterium]|jgi:outer membrane protein OmpA-like peptidoglycan-associated protein|nr:OmpA family protein [Ignavibacteria bacterium]